MRRTIALMLSFLFFICHAFAQTSTSRVVYHAKHDLPGLNLLIGENILHFSTKGSLFVHPHYPMQNDISEVGNMAFVTTGDKEGFPVFVSLTDSLIYSKISNFFGGYTLTILKEKLDTIDWQIDPTTQKKIKGYNCLRASAFYEGRQYEVWFSPDIPAPFGPYRLQGLPGLILEAASEDGKVAWEFVGYEPVTTKPVVLQAPTNGDVYVWEDLVEAKINYKIQKESHSTIDRIIKISDGNPECFIEKGKFSIYKKYLK